MKKRSLTVFCAAVLALAFFAGCALQDRFGQGQPGQEAPAESAQPHPYGVFVGLNPEDVRRMEGYETVVIDAAAFDSGEIEALHRAGHTVYSYLNIGSVERFREYYRQFKDMTLGKYENWPDERWVDVSRPEWRDFLAGTCAKELTDKGIDGFFLDNADVYEQYPRPEIYSGLLKILKSLKKYQLPILVNGGGRFVKEMLESGETQGLPDGVNQEEVFTFIDFETGRCGRQEQQETDDFCAYLTGCKEAGLTVYLTEYGADEALCEKITAYCGENGFYWYGASSPALDGK